MQNHFIISRFHVSKNVYSLSLSHNLQPHAFQEPSRKRRRLPAASESWAEALFFLHTWPLKTLLGQHVHTGLQFTVALPYTLCLQEPRELGELLIENYASGKSSANNVPFLQAVYGLGFPIDVGIPTYRYSSLRVISIRYIYIIYIHKHVYALGLLILEL